MNRHCWLLDRGQGKTPRPIVVARFLLYSEGGVLSAILAPLDYSTNEAGNGSLDTDWLLRQWAGVTEFILQPQPDPAPTDSE